MPKINLLLVITSLSSNGKNTDIAAKQIIVVAQFRIDISRPSFVSRTDKFEDGLGSRRVIPVDTYIDLVVTSASKSLNYQ
jgi:hypothetical protein